MFALFLANDVRNPFCLRWLNSVKPNSAPPKQIKSTPAELDFGDTPICICHMETVTFVNVGDHAIEFNTVMIDSLHYHHSLHEPVTVGPRGNVTLNVVFLPSMAEGVLRMWCVGYCLLGFTDVPSL